MFLFKQSILVCNERFLAQKTDPGIVAQGAPILEYVLAITVEEFSNYVYLLISASPTYGWTAILSRILVLIFLFLFSWIIS